MMLLPLALLFVALQDPAAAAPETLPVSPAAPASTSAAPTGSAADHIHAGLGQYWHHRYTQAATHFEEALAADPQSAAAAWYLAYTYYKIAEPKRPFHADKQKAADMFAKAYAMDPNFKPDWGKGAPAAQ